MTQKVYVVRADGGKYAEAFRKGGYIAIGGNELGDLSGIKDYDELVELYTRIYPDVTSKISLGLWCGFHWRFNQEISEGDYVTTPTLDSARLVYGQVSSGYYFDDKDPTCEYAHRRKVKWSSKELLRSDFPVPVQYALKAYLTIFKLRHEADFFKAIDRSDLIPEKGGTEKISYYEAVIEKILQLDATEFEQLLMELLASIGFESEHVGGPGDKGIDVVGKLDVYGLASIDLKVQAKRYQKGATVNEKEIVGFRGSLPEKAQGAFITTSHFQKKAREQAINPEFKKVGIINGEQLVDILVERYDSLSWDLKDKLSLKKVLVPE